MYVPDEKQQIQVEYDEEGDSVFYVMTEASEDSSVFNITADTVRTSSGVPLITVEVCKLLIYMIDTHNVLSSKAPLRYTSTATACSASSIINSNTQPPATVFSSTMTLNTSKRTDDNSITSSELYLIVGLALSGVVVCGTASCTIFLVALIVRRRRKSNLSAVEKSEQSGKISVKRDTISSDYDNVDYSYATEPTVCVLHTNSAYNACISSDGATEKETEVNNVVTGNAALDIVAEENVYDPVEV